MREAIKLRINLVFIVGGNSFPQYRVKAESKGDIIDVKTQERVWTAEVKVGPASITARSPSSKYCKVNSS
jgi:hypothetical protein